MDIQKEIVNKDSKGKNIAIAVLAILPVVHKEKLVQILKIKKES